VWKNIKQIFFHCLYNEAKVAAIIILTVSLAAFFFFKDSREIIAHSFVRNVWISANLILFWKKCLSLNFLGNQNFAKIAKFSDLSLNFCGISGKLPNVTIFYLSFF